MSLPQVYVASKTRHAAMWQQFKKGTTVPNPDNAARRFLVPPWRISSSWIDEAGVGKTRDLRELWERIQNEVKGSAGLIMYADKSDFGSLKGAYIEVGMALAFGIPVSVGLPGVTLENGTYRPIGSWVTHPCVIQVYTGYDPQNVWQNLDVWLMRRGQ